MRANVTVGIEIEQLIELQKLVKKRGVKNISVLVREAIEMYIKKHLEVVA